MTSPTGSPFPAQQSAARTQDPGIQALERALRASFRLLQLLIAVLLVLFLASGFFTVEDGKVALVLHLGKIRQVQKAGIVVPDVLQAGGHWAWPDPIDKVIRLPAGEQSLEVKAFWYNDEARDATSGQKAIPKTLIPGLDGYCVTGDRNILHTSWSVHYRIDSPVDYFLATGEAPDAVLESLLSRAVVRTAGERTIDDAFLADVERFQTTVEQRFRELADRLRLGIHVSKVNMVEKSAPRQTREAFLAATDAGNKKRLMEDEAKSEANRIRQNAGAEKARVVAEAAAYRTRIVLEAQADANTFQQLLPKFQKDPDGLRQQLFIEAMSEVMAKAKERFVFSPETEKRRVVRIELESQSQRRPKEKKEETEKGNP
jgi:membrane protease subunit HflK